MFTDTARMTLFTFLEMADGTLKSSFQFVQECPSADEVIPMFQKLLETGEALSFYVNCVPIPFRALTGT